MILKTLYPSPYFLPGLGFTEHSSMLPWDKALQAQVGSETPFRKGGGGAGSKTL